MTTRMKYVAIVLLALVLSLSSVAFTIEGSSDVAHTSPIMLASGNPGTCCG